MAEELLDDLKTPSITEEDPLFSLKNMFKPTSKNVVIWATLVKLICAGLVTGCAFMIPTDPHYYLAIVVGCIVVGAIAEAFVLFTKQAPVSSLIRAAEDIKVNPEQALQSLTTDANTISTSAPNN